MHPSILTSSHAILSRQGFARARCALITGVAGLAFASTAAAQDAPASQASASEPVVLNEIVVTATKRDEKLQDVPAAITAFTTQVLERTNINRPMDFINATPNMTAVEANNAGDLRITIRGDAQALNTDAPVAVVIDGVVLTGATGLNKDLLDVQQIEVLKGPQGYLYGRNAISGAINITTRAPTDELTGQAKVGYGNGQSATAAFAIAGPIVPGVLRVSVAAGYRDTRGFYKSITTNDYVDPYNEKSGRIRLDWLATEDLTIQVSAFMSRIEGSATNYQSQSQLSSLQTSTTRISADYADGEFVSNIANFNTKHDDLVSLRIDYDQDWGRISSISSYEYQNNIFASDGFPYSTGSGDGTQWNQRSHKAKTTELRFTSPGDQPLRYIFGGYYADIDQTPYLLAATGEDDCGFVRRDAPPISSGCNQTTTLSVDNVFSKAWALFANFDYSVTDALTLTVAGRYDHEDKDAIDVAYGFSSTAGQVRSNIYKKFQPKVSLAYAVNEDVNLYATYAVGFKAGGFNAAQAFTITNGAAPNEYPAEQAENWEVGAKSQWLGGLLTLNGALFRTYKDNSQLFQFIPTGFLNAVTTIDKVRATGGELEIAARPTEALTLRAGIGYTEAKITDYVSQPTYEGNKAPYIPDWKTSLDATYVVPVQDGLDLVVNGRWDHTGRIYYDARNSSQARRSPLNLFSSRVALEGERWSFAVWGKNLTDKRYNSDVIVVFDDLALGGGAYTQAVFKAPPRTYGAELSFKF